MVLTRLPLYVGTTLPSSTPVGHPARVPAGNDLSAEEIVVAYHERTKHHYHRFAASVGYMDWATQPDPFRRYEGASLVRLPFPEMGQALPYWQLYVADSMEPAPLSIRLRLAVLPLRPLADRVETVPRNDVVSSRQPLERKPAPDGGICAPACRWRHPRPSRRLPLRTEGTRSRASSRC